MSDKFPMNQNSRQNFCPLDRRQMLRGLAGGFGSVGLASLLSETSASGSTKSTDLPHFPARAKRVIFLFMNGGPAQMDTFDPKPALTKWAGKRLPVLEQNTNKLLGKPRPLGNAFPSPWKFKPHGDSGIEVSELFPHVARQIDKICLLRSMCCDSFFHAQGTLEMMTGSGLFLRPSIGSWMTYGLGTENKDLPGFIVLGNPMSLVDTTKAFGSSFLPAEHQGTFMPDLKDPVPNLKPFRSESDQRAQLDLIRALNQKHLEGREETSALNARIESLDRKSVV